MRDSTGRLNELNDTTDVDGAVAWLLLTAVRYIERDGWRRNGEPAGHTLEDALRIASAGSVSDWHPRGSFEELAEHRAHAHLLRYLAVMQRQPIPVDDWNDLHCRNKAHAVELLQSAAQMWSLRPSAVAA